MPSLADCSLDWLVNGGVITHEQRSDAAAFFAVSASGWSGPDLEAAIRNRSNALRGDKLQ